MTLEESTKLGHEYDNIQIKLSSMNETELETNYAQNLMDRAFEIRKLMQEA